MRFTGNRFIARCRKFCSMTNLVLIAAVQLSLLSACSLFPTEEVMVQPPVKEPPKVEYSLYEVKRDTIESRVTCRGTFVSTSQYDLSFKYRGGRLKSMNVRLGDSVKKGDILAELDTDELENQIMQQEIRVKKAQSEYHNVKRKGEENVELIRLQLEELTGKLDRMKAACGEDEAEIYEVFSREMVEDLEYQIERQQIALENAVEDYNTDLKQAEQDVELEEIQLSSLKQQLDKARLVSPVDGVVVYTHIINIGEYVDAYQTLVRVADPESILLQHSGDKVYSFELGAKVQVVYTGNTYEGEVVMNPYNMPSDSDTDLRQSVRVKVSDLPDGIRIGDTADISMLLEKREDVIVLPKRLVHFKVNRKYVNILENGVKKERDVEVGMMTETQVEIVKGLQEGEKVIER